MKKEDLMNAMNNIDPAMIGEAEPKERKASGLVWKRVGLLAACFVLVAGVVVGTMLAASRNEEHIALPSGDKTVLETEKSEEPTEKAHKKTTENTEEPEQKTEIPTDASKEESFFVTGDPGEDQSGESKGNDDRKLEESGEPQDPKETSSETSEPEDPIIIPLYYVPGSGADFRMLATATKPYVGRAVVTEQFADAYLRFAADFLLSGRTDNEDGVVSSPLSAITALSIAANGAKGNTLSQMLSVLTGGKMSMDELNAMMKQVYGGLSSDDNAKFKSANAVFLSSDPSFFVNPDFLKKVIDYYEADVYETNFGNAELASGKINEWVNDKTDGKIPELIGPDMLEDAVSVLLNAISFDAKWAERVLSQDVANRPFYGVKGEISVPMMHTEGKYLHGDHEEGFLKYYRGNQYAFVGLLPNEDIADLGTYIGEYLTPWRWKELLASKSDTADVILPLFKQNARMDLVGFLKEKGMTDAFDSGKANLTGLGISENGNIFISGAVQKAMIEVNTEGTSAAAATGIVVEAESCNQYFVCMDRPFVYAIIDTATGLPIFLGTVENIVNE